MTPERDMDQILGAFFADGATRVPDRVLNAVADRIERQPQRPAWRLDWRHPGASPRLRLISALAAVIIMASVLVRLVPLGSIGVAAPTSSPSASPTVSPTPIPSPKSLTITRENSELAPGGYVHDRSTPHVEFTVPVGWMFEYVRSGHFAMRPTAFESSSNVSTWYDMRVASKDPGCTEVPEPGLGHTAADLVTDFRTRPGIVATVPIAVNVGGLDGRWFDLSLSPSWTKVCPQLRDLGPSVALFIDDLPDDLLVNGNPYWGVSGTERLRVIVLDDGHGSTVMITITAPDAATFERLVAATMPVIDTFRFAVTP